MKNCPMCGEKYDIRVDFCFADGTPLEMPAAAQPAAASTSGGDAGLILDAPEPGGYSMFDAPEPEGFGVGAEEPEGADVEESPGQSFNERSASDLDVDVPGQPSAHSQETVTQDEEDSRLPVGFHSPPSEFEGGDNDFGEDAFFDEVPESDDLGFPDGFGADDGYEFTEPTIPAPRRSRAPKLYVLAAVGALAAGLAVVFFTGGDDEKVSPNDDAIEVAQEVRTTVAPAPAPVQQGQGIAGAEEIGDTSQDQQASDGVEAAEDETPGAQDEEAEVAPAQKEAEAVLQPKPDPDPVVEKPASQVRESPKPKIVDPPPLKAPAEIGKEPGGAEEAFDPWATQAPSAQSLVTIKSTPSGATLYVDSRMRGKTPTSLELTMGEHSIRLQKEGYVETSDSIKVEKARQSEKYRLTAEPRRVTVNCYGPDKSKVYLGGQVICAIPGSGTIMEGEHTFRVVTPDRFFKRTLKVKRQSDNAPTKLIFRE